MTCQKGIKMYAANGCRARIFEATFSAISVGTRFGQMPRLVRKPHSALPP